MSSSLDFGIRGAKFDDGKANLFRGALDYFPRALEQVAAASAFGATKYAWKSWQDVPEGFERYSDALVRHLTAPSKGEFKDGDSGLLHAAHVAWNALARLELLLMESEVVKQKEPDRGPAPGVYIPVSPKAV